MDGGTVSNGQFMPNSLDGSPVISSGSGDIILVPTLNGKKGGKKWLAVVVVVLFVIAVVTGIAVMVMGDGGGNKTTFLMYPLCGALGGISSLIKGIVIQQQGVHLWMMVVAMVAPFLHFFLLPSLLKGTIAALGKVGGALAAMGTAWRGGLMAGERAVQSTDSYKKMDSCLREDCVSCTRRNLRAELE